VVKIAHFGIFICGFSCRTAFRIWEATKEALMGRGLLLWLIGIPLPIILLIWLFGGLH
jgi:hypothetical protein